MGVDVQYPIRPGSSLSDPLIKNEYYVELSSYHETEHSAFVFLISQSAVGSSRLTSTKR